MRDWLMGRVLIDWDIEVHRLEADALEGVLGRVGSVSLVGRSFGVYKVRPPGWLGSEIDVSIPRKDSKVGPGHRGIAVAGDPFLGIEEASRRRDLTVNAMMVDLATRELLDPWNGARDLRERRLRAVDRHTFLEDPLRALRAVQFAARLAFDVDPQLVALCAEAALDELPCERILGEWAKLLLQADRPSVGLELARQARIVERVFPEAAPWVDTDAVVDRMVGHRNRCEQPGHALAWMLAAWLHRAPADAALATFDRLGLHRYLGFDTRTSALALVAHHRDPIATDADLRWLSTRAEVAGALALVSARDHVDTGPIAERASALGVLHEAPPPLLQGRHLKPLGIRPGPHMGVLLKAVYAAQLDGQVQTFDEAVDLAKASES